MSDIELRPVEGDEVKEFAAAFGISFGWDVEEKDLPFWRWLQEGGRTLAAFQDGKIVATAGIISFELTLPGLTTAPSGGVTIISVLPTHRRRGILRSIMSRQLEDMRERGEHTGILWASESIIYGRFGYGLATNQADLKIRRAHGVLDRAPEAPGSIRLLERDEAAGILPPIYDRFRRQIPGQIDREPGWWKEYLEDNPRDRRGASRRYYAVYSDGGDQGYAAYRIKNEWPGGIPSGTANVNDLVATTPGAYRALWRYLLDLDLVDTLSVGARPLEEPLRWMLADPRRLRFEDVGDAIWLRVADVTGALEDRRYMVEGTLTLQVADSFCPENTGTYRLEGGPGGARCRRVDGDADLALDITDLGAAYLGGTRVGTLATSGRVEELRPGALRLADAMFASDIAPWCDHHF
jgi:predicted acetyltransferase